MPVRMATITVVGLGPGPVSLLTKEAERELLQADKIFFRTGSYPAYDWLGGLGKTLVCFDRLYHSFRWPSCEDLYSFMTNALLKEVEIKGSAVYALPGSPVVLEDTTRMLLIRGAERGVEVKVVQGMSFIEPALAAINFDAGMGLQIVLPRMHVRSGRFSKRLGMLVCQIEAREQANEPPRIDLTMQWLLETYPPDHPVTLIWTAGLPAYEIEHKVVALKELEREYGKARYFASLFVPPVSD
jgi:tetrapyrrole methylase family protein/MazG family protein